MCTLWEAHPPITKPRLEFAVFPAILHAILLDHIRLSRLLYVWPTAHPPTTPPPPTTSIDSTATLPPWYPNLTSRNTGGTPNSEPRPAQPHYSRTPPRPPLPAGSESSHIPTLQTIEVPPARSSPNPGEAPARVCHSASLPEETTLPPAAMQFTDSFRGVTWNTQALFARKTGRQSAKRRHAMQLMQSNDFAGWQETHSTYGAARALQLLADIRSFWSHDSARKAGVGLWVKEALLSNLIR